MSRFRGAGDRYIHIQGELQGSYSYFLWFGWKQGALFFISENTVSAGGAERLGWD